MTIIGKLNKLKIEFNGETILEEAGAEIPAGARIGIVGANGSGKSSLLEAMASGNPAVQWTVPNLSLAFMEQEVREPDIKYGAIESLKLATKWNVPKERSGLSGGEMMKVRLAKTMAQKADLLLLDEPTNHLDADSVQQVTRQLKNYNGTLFIVSHDRHFLDETATCIWEIEDKKLVVYEGNYSAYREQKEHQQSVLRRKYDKQQAEVARVEKQIAELQSWSGKAHADSTKQDGYKEYYRSKAKRMDVQISSKRKRLQKELDKEGVSQPKEQAEVKFDITGPAKKGKRVVELKAAGKRFGSLVLFENASLTVQQGERLGLIGPNGSGKSTLFNMLRGKTDYSGEIWMTDGMKVGYLSQDVFDLPEEQTPAELFGAGSFEMDGKTRTLMTNLGFSKHHWEEPIGHMSMGERVKLKLMEFMLDECHVLLLDEPTNHLDLPSRERLEQTLATFPGTLIFASHDRYFMEKLANKLLIFEGESLKKFEGGYVEWTKRSAAKPNSDFLQLDTERQAILGKLSFLKPGDKEYAELDRRFMELTSAIKALKF